MRRLRAVIVAAGFALVAVFLLAPVAGHGQGIRGVGSVAAADSLWGGVASVLLGLVVGRLAWSVALVCLPGMSDHLRPDSDGQHRGRRDVYTLLLWLPPWP